MIVEPWLAWIIVAVVLLIVEMVTPTVFFFACFGLGSAVASAAAYFHAGQTVQWTVFFVSTVGFLLMARPISKKFMKTESRPSNVDEMIGKEALVTEPISPHHAGMVKVRAELWRAECDQEIAVGQKVEVLSVDGTHLIVKLKV